MTRPADPALVTQLHDHLTNAARRAPGAVALVADGERLDYGEVDARSNALAHALAKRGVARGDRVAIFAENTIETAIAFWAVLKANAVATILNPQMRAEKLAGVLNDCEPAALVTLGRHTAVVAAAAAGAPALRIVVVAGPAEDSRVADLPGVASWDEMLASGERASPPPRRNLEIDLAALVYTSGSMGDSRAVMLTHRNMIATAASITSYLGNDPSDVILGVLPLSFTYGLYQLVTAFQAGARLVLERSFAYPAQVLHTVVEERVTGFPGVPTIFARLAEMKRLSDFDLSCLRYVTNAAAALPVRHVRMLRALLPQARLVLMYGQTECGRGTWLPPEAVDGRPDSIGIAIPNSEVWLVDEAGRRLPPGATGELVIRGAHVMKGYWKRPRETARRLRRGPVPGERVLHTGDICRMDDDGYLYFVGRMDETIKSRGEKVAPREIENVLMEIPGVREAAVIGVPDDLLGHVVKAFVVPEADAILTERGVQLECQKRLEAFMVPRLVAIVADLPRTTSGKILKAALK